MSAGAPQELAPTSPLPEITGAVVLDGTTQPGYSSTPLITISGRLAGQFSEGLVLRGNVSTVRGLTVRSFNGHGIVVYGNGNNIERCYVGIDPLQTFGAGNRDAGVSIENGRSNSLRGNVISGNGLSGVIISGTGARYNDVTSGNRIGTNANGTLAVPNGQHGVWIGNGASDNYIGGLSNPNVISGNHWAGVALVHSGTSSNLLLGNYIGTNAAGTAALGNGVGVYVAQGASNNRIWNYLSLPGAPNIISGNRNEGVVLTDPGTSNNRVEGNYIGTNFTGTAAVPNQRGGVVISNGASLNTIGGVSVGSRNVISGNTFSGVSLLHGNTRDNVVEGNYIGTNAAGTAALGNTGHGVAVALGAQSNRIGGLSTAARNVISANHEAGVIIRDGGTSANLVLGNRIGTNAAGTAPLGNRQDGVQIALGASGNTIGGSLVGQGNTIAYNGTNGVGTVAAGRGNLLRGNAIYGNGALGIDLDWDTVTSAHTVELTGAWTSGTATTIEGWVIGRPNATYTVELFASAAADPSGFGEGETPLPGLYTISTDAYGYGNLLATLPFPLTVGSCVSATATESDGTTGEFSNCLAVVPSGESLSALGGDAARVLGLASSSRSAPPALLPSREHPSAEGPTLRADGAPFRDHRRAVRAVDAFFGGRAPLPSEAPPRRTAAVLPGEDAPHFWERLFVLDES